jgi:hypothetical protein
MSDLYTCKDHTDDEAIDTKPYLQRQAWVSGIYKEHDAYLKRNPKTESMVAR